MPSVWEGEPGEVSRLTEDVAPSRRCARSDFASAVVAWARVASVQQGVTRRSANRTTVDELGVAGGGVRSAPRRRLHLPCGHLLGYAHNGDGAVRSSSACLV